MSNDYNRKTKNQEEGNIASAVIASLETKLLDGFSSVKDEVINLKETCNI